MRAQSRSLGFGCVQPPRRQSFERYAYPRAHRSQTKRRRTRFRRDRQRDPSMGSRLRCLAARGHRGRTTRSTRGDGSRRVGTSAPGVPLRWLDPGVPTIVARCPSQAAVTDRVTVAEADCCGVALAAAVYRRVVATTRRGRPRWISPRRASARSPKHRCGDAEATASAFLKCAQRPWRHALIPSKV